MSSRNRHSHELR